MSWNKPKKFSGWFIKSSLGSTVVMPWEIGPATKIAEENGLYDAKTQEDQMAVFFAAVVQYRMSKKKRTNED